MAENQNIDIPVAGNFEFIGTCDAASTSVSATAGVQATVTAASCVAGVLSVSVSINGLPLIAHVSRSLSVHTTNANNGGVSPTVIRQYGARGSCPANYLVVPGNSTYGTSDFCVAKFEMKAVTTNPVGQEPGAPTLAHGGDGNATYDSSWFPDSRPDGTPWVNISQRQAVLMCDKLNPTTGGTGNYQLITNDQWQTLAADIASQPANWSGLAVGSGQLPRGNSKNAVTDPNQGLASGLSFAGNNTLAAASMDGTTVPYGTLTTPALEFAAGYRGTGNSASQAVGSGWEQRRTNYLSTGQVIWDAAGNTWTQVRFTTACSTCALDSAIPGNTAGTYNSRFVPAQGNTGGDNYFQLSLPSLFSDLGGSGGMLSVWLQPNGSFWDNVSNLPASFGLGRFYNTNNGVAGTYGLVRGGRFRFVGSADENGIFAGGANDPPSFSHYSYGFVCAINP